MVEAVDTSQTIQAAGNLYMGVAGNVASTLLCYVAEDDPINLTMTQERLPIRVQGHELPYRTTGRLTAAMIAFSAPIFSPKIIEFIMGKAQSSSTTTATVTVGNATAGAALLPQYSFRFVGNTLDGAPLTVDFPYCSVGNGLETALTQTAASKIPFEVNAESHTSLYPTIKWTTDGDLFVAIDTGDLDRVPGLTYMKSETTGAGDVVDTITDNGTALVDGEVLALKIWDTDEPITLKHLGDTLELLEGSDLPLTQLEDIVWVQYTAAGTVWIEIGRYIAP